jgi:hypothetical protein
MTLHYRNGKHGDVTAQLETALVRYAETNDPADHQECLRLWEISTQFKSGCGACISGRSLFIKSLTDIANGDGAAGIAKMRGAMKSVTIKWDVLKSKIGL